MKSLLFFHFWGADNYDTITIAEAAPGEHPEPEYERLFGILKYDAFFNHLENLRTHWDY